SPLETFVEQQQRSTREAAAAAVAELERRDAITVVTCGTGTPIPSDRAQACTAVFANGLFLLFDAGDGAERSMERSLLPMARIDAVFLTHFHSDHVADLGEVVSRSWILGRREPLPVFGGEGVTRIVAGIDAVYAADDNYRTTHHGDDILAPEFAGAEAHRIDDPGEQGRVVFERDGVRVTAFRVNHAPVAPAFGYRVEHAGRSVVVSGDTTATASLREASRDADLLVAEVMNSEILQAAECSFRRAGDDRNRRLVRDIRSYHVATTDLAALAEQAGVRRLVLTHLIPTPGGEDPRADVFFGEPVRRGFSGEVVVARDGQRFVVEVGS
ncbi:MAG: MBL fold metallo-hydrolase, partial [Alphaproteobacteria bacterium]